MKGTDLVLRVVLPAAVVVGAGVAVAWSRDSGAGPLEAREVGSLEELVARLSACPAPRHFVPDAPHAPGESADVRMWGGGCPHLVYVWSPTMPLSIEAKPEIAAAAEALEVPLSFLSAAALLDGGAEPGESADRRAERAPARASDAGRLSDALVAAGATVHYPSVTIFEGGLPRGNAIVGHKRAEGYRRLLEPRLGAIASTPAPEPAPIGGAAQAAVRGAGDGPPRADGSTPHRPDIHVVWSYPMPAPTPGAFFRRVPGTRFITFDQNRSVHLLDLETGERLLGPGWIDFVPSPDGRLFVTPADGHAGLEFYVASEVFRLARASGRASPAFTDQALTDQYPSVGILAQEPGEAGTVYRILTSWFAGLAMRDYEVRRGPEGSTIVMPLTPKMEACPGMGLSTPILSKDGREIAARDEATGTTKVFRVDGEGRCSELLDLGRQTSKVGFSEDGRLIAFSSPDRAGPRPSSTTYVYDRVRRSTTTVPNSSSLGLVIPEVVGADSLLILVREDARNAATEFRLLCCLR